jgi:hypothetical protein
MLTTDKVLVYAKTRKLPQSAIDYSTWEISPGGFAVTYCTALASCGGGNPNGGPVRIKVVRRRA